MVRGRARWMRDDFKAHRLDRFWAAANIVAMVHNTTRSDSSDGKPAKHFYDLMNGDEPAVEDVDDYDDGSSLAKLKAERRERERVAVSGE